MSFNVPVLQQNKQQMSQVGSTILHRHCDEGQVSKVVMGYVRNRMRSARFNRCSRAKKQLLLLLLFLQLSRKIVQISAQLRIELHYQPQEIVVSTTSTSTSRILLNVSYQLNVRHNKLPTKSSQQKPKSNSNGVKTERYYLH